MTKIEKEKEKGEGTKSIARALDILECFTLYNPALSVTDLSEMLRLPFSSTARIARTLKERGYLDRDRVSKKFKLGRKVYFLGYTAKESNLLWIASKPYLKKLRDLFKETTVIYLRDGLQRVCFEQEESNQSLRYSGPIGASYGLQAGSPSRVFWAFMDWSEVLKVVKDIVPTTPHTIFEKDSILKIIEKVWEDGFAVSQDDYVMGYSSVSAPIFNAKMEMIATITITGPSFRFTQQLIPSMCLILRSAGIEISEALGCNYQLLREKFPISFPLSRKPILGHSNEYS